MKKRCTEEQSIRIIRDAEAGETIVSLCRRYGIAEATSYRPRQEYQGLAK